MSLGRCVGLFFLVVAGVVTIQGVILEPSRIKRGIFGTVTSTVYKTIEDKHYVPASCIHIAPNLPDCRNVRFINNYPNNFNFFGTILLPINQNSTQNVTNSELEANVTTANVQGWGSFLGLYRPTITVTELKLHPTTVLDPRIIVTYDIRGCKPQSLSYDLPKCEKEENSLEFVEVVPTSTVGIDIQPTKVPDNTQLSSKQLQGTKE
ncbi:hypothetical protein ABEB36_001240 [Hypothenemus hampei]|uniref:Secreted protein n=1 Tax=Hypothenemus hampei TaxID=57062 RepID=A0ABD1FFS4_HYPHA